DLAEPEGRVLRGVLRVVLVLALGGHDGHPGHDDGQDQQDDPLLLFHEEPPKSGENSSHDTVIRRRRSVCSKRAAGREDSRGGPGGTKVLFTPCLPLSLTSSFRFPSRAAVVSAAMA